MNPTLREFTTEEVVNAIVKWLRFFGDEHPYDEIADAIESGAWLRRFSYED